LGENKIVNEHPEKWMRLDNAAKIYPASRSRRWMAVFRLSAQLAEPVDPEILSGALARTLRRFPSFSQRLRRGLFWYYFEHIEGSPSVEPDVNNPCAPIRFRENGGFMLRVRYHDCRIAVEFFHALTDGTGALCFLKTLVAEYLTARYGAVIPRGKEILDCDQPAKAEESEDGFLKYARSFSRSRNEPSAYHIRGTHTGDLMAITTGVADAEPLLMLAHSHGATLTEFLTAALISAIDRVQLKHQPERKKHKPVKICVPINLRKYYGTNTMRNFASYINPGIPSRYGEYTLEEIVKIVHGFMSMELNEKLLNARFSTNVMSERNLLLRMAPLPLKEQAMRLVFLLQGDRQTSSVLSNLGKVSLPEEMKGYVRRFDFIVGPLSRNRIACGCISYDGRLVVNFNRSVRESDVERNFFTALVKLGVHITVESNQRR